MLWEIKIVLIVECIILGFFSLALTLIFGTVYQIEKKVDMLIDVKDKDKKTQSEDCDGNFTNKQN